MPWRRISLAGAMAVLLQGGGSLALAQDTGAHPAGGPPDRTLGFGDEGVGALAKPELATPGPLAASASPAGPALTNGPVSDAPGGSTAAPVEPAVPPHHRPTHRPRTGRPSALRRES